jgi:hypothetical protein
MAQISRPAKAGARLSEPDGARLEQANARLAPHDRAVMQQDNGRFVIYRIERGAIALHGTHYDRYVKVSGSYADLDAALEAAARMVAR